MEMFPEMIAKAEPGQSLIIIVGEEGGLTKEQKRFNKLAQQIKRVRQDLASCELAWDNLHRKHRPRLIEARKATNAAITELVVALHECPWRGKLPKKLKQKLADIMVQEIDGLLIEGAGENEERLKELFAQYHPAKISYEEMLEQSDEMGRHLASDMARSMFGIDIPPDDLDDDEKLRAYFEKLRGDKEASAAAKQEGQATRKATKKKTEKQIQVEARREEVEEALSKTTRRIYLDLVKHYHPDREQDEALRNEKTEWMKQITAAYEAGDQLKLLELQMTLLSDRGNAFASFNEEQLKHLNKSLQLQSRELQMKLHFAGLGQPGDVMAPFFDLRESIVKTRVDSEIRALTDQTQFWRHVTSQAVASEVGYRQVIKDFALSDPDFGAFGAPFLDSPF